MKQTAPRWLLLLALQFIVILYSLSNVMSKIASGYPFLSLPYILAYGGEILLLGIYAILWQQMIRRLNLTTAYASRATALFWSMLWARLFFGETISLPNIIGVILVITGTLVVITDD
ncbi:MAG: transporter [Clostridia bacterium]|nr:transporter [Clostridia bacterium]